MDIKEWVREARKSKGWSQQELGERLSRTKANVGHWETGKHKPSFEQLAHISRVTDYPLPSVGASHPNDRPGSTQSPDPPPRFEGARTLDAEQWEQWQAFKMVATPEERRAIMERYEALKVLAEQVHERLRRQDEP